MALQLHTIKSAKGSRKVSKRVGRGLGSKGTYSGRGTKGQRSRSGVSGLRLMGLRKIMLSQPKSRGFKSHHVPPVTVSITDLARAFADGARVNPDTLRKKGLVEDISNGIKVLGTGTIGIKLLLSDVAVSAGAKEKIEKAGGSVS